MQRFYYYFPKTLYNKIFLTGINSNHKKIGIMSWLEKIEELTIDQLKKKEKMYKKYVIGTIILFSLCFIGMIIIELDWIGATLPLLVLVINSIRVRKKIRVELKKRENAT